MVSSFTRISDAVMSPQIKSIANYRNSEVAVQEARLAGYDSTIILNRVGEVSEGAWSNLFLIRNGVLITPHLGSDILGGITRDTFIRLARETAGLNVEERGVSRTELYLCDEAFLCGTALEIQAIGSIDRFVIRDGEIGPITRGLRSAYIAAVRGDDGAYPEWRTSARLPQSVG
jgi:branched-chain amino acid aminotransferase